MNPRIAIYECDEKRMKCEKRKKKIEETHLEPSLWCEKYIQLMTDYVHYMRLGTPVKK